MSIRGVKLSVKHAFQYLGPWVIMLIQYTGFQCPLYFGYLTHGARCQRCLGQRIIQIIIAFNISGITFVINNTIMIAVNFTTTTTIIITITTTQWARIANFGSSRHP